MRRPFRSGALAVALPLAAAVALAATRRPEPQWFRGNLHTHSLWSDGNDFPEMIVDWYVENGYQFVALSDHNVLADHERWVENDLVIRRGGRTALSEYRERFGADWVETRDGPEGKLEVRLKRLDEYAPLFDAKGRFLVLQAEEITDSFDRRPIHMNATNVAERVAPQHGDSVREVIRNNLTAAREQAERLGRPILVHLNHPNFGWGVTAEDIAHVVEERFFEVWNGHPGVRHRGDDVHAGVERLWDIANTLRIAELRSPPLYGLATDDSHNYHNPSGATPGRGWVCVRATELSVAALLAAIAAGDFYASSGVALHDVRFEDDVLTVEVDAVEGETYTIDFVGTRRESVAAGEPVVDADGEELPVTRRYPEAIGERLERVVGTRAAFRVTEDLLYVRAVVTSSADVANPVWEGQKKTAWTQPVGWRRHLAE